MTASVKQEGGMIKDGCYETKSVGMYAKLKKSMMMIARNMPGRYYSEVSAISAAMTPSESASDGIEPTD